MDKVPDLSSPKAAIFLNNINQLVKVMELAYVFCKLKIELLHKFQACKC